MALPIAVSMLAQFALQLVDLYFVTRLGVSATAGVNAAGNVIFVTIAVSQVLGIGTVVLIAHGVGRRDYADVRIVLHQCLSLALFCGLVAVAVILAFVGPYLELISPDRLTFDAGMTFIAWALPGYALTFPMAVLGSALRGAGKPVHAAALSIFIVLLNAALAPLFIAEEAAGWGVKGAGLATSVSVLAGFTLCLLYCARTQRWMRLQYELMWPRYQHWGRILRVGIPAGCDFGMHFLFTAIVYYAIRDFGVVAQAGYAMGSQVLQMVALPGMAIAYAAGPIAGQNFGARNAARVTETFRKTAALAVAVMAVAIVVIQWQPGLLLGLLDADLEAIAAASEFLRAASWALAAQVLVSVCSGMFQAMAYTVPSVVSSSVRLVTFAVPTFWLYFQSSLEIEHVWHLYVVSLGIQAVLSLWLVTAEFRRRLPQPGVVISH
ncbi:MATE family efflux transporter [Steroidobacter flavus]|uniref:Multidrug-efflux transporter n=1 Tax=Steroidobacter flavus TaxID=1842136 RepID=A0ABV8SXY6_9GAMM